MFKSIEDPNFQKVVPNTAWVIYAWDEKILRFYKYLKFYIQVIYKNDHIIDIHVNTEMLTTELVIPSRTKHRPSGVNSYQRYQDYNLIRQTRVSST